MTVRESIVELIITGEYDAGSRLTEGELATRLGVSRTPVREALKQLETDGVVEIERNKGARIIELTPSRVSALFEARAVVEPLVAGMSAPLLTNDDLTRMTVLNEEMEAAAAREDMLGVTVHNNAFHTHLMSRCPNAPLRANAVAMLRPLVVARSFKNYSSAQIRRSVRHHQELVDAARSGDGEWVTALLKAHILSGRHSATRQA